MDFSLFGFSGLKEAMNVHPVFVHFPIALFPASLFLYLLGAALHRRSLTVCGRATLYLAAAGAFIAVLTGLAAQHIPHNAQIHHIMGTHKTIGFAVFGLALLLSAWSFWQIDQRPRAFWGFLVVHALASALVLQNGDLGGRMVFLEGAAVKPAVSVIMAPAEAPEADRGKPPVQPHSHHDHSGHRH